MMFLLSLGVNAIVESEHSHGGGKTGYKGKYIKYPGMPTMNWQDAKDFCASQGYILPVFCSGRGRTELKNFAGTSVWMDFTDVQHEGKWVPNPKAEKPECFTSGFKLWQDGQPDNLVNSDCARMRRDGWLDDVHCQNTKLDVICMKLPDSLLVKSDGGKYTNYMNQQGMNWNEAKLFCEKRGKKLPTICSQADLDDLYTLPRWFYWLSLNDRKHEGKFVWDARKTCPTEGFHEMWTNNPKDRFEGGNVKGEDCVQTMEGHAGPDAYADRRCDDRWSWSFTACMEDNCPKETCKACPKYYASVDIGQCCNKCVKPTCGNKICFDNPSSFAKVVFPKSLPCSVCCDKTSWCLKSYGVCHCAK